MTDSLTYTPGQIVDRATIRQIYARQPTLSFTDAAAILDAHSLGAVQSLQHIAGTWMNTTYEIVPRVHAPVIVKIQHRPGVGSLATEQAVIHALQPIPTLPVSRLCLLDTSGAVIPFPYLLVEKLPGLSARMVFEHADHATRLTLATMLGETVGTIHAQTTFDPASLQCLDLHIWPQLLVDALDDAPLQRAIQGISASFFEQLSALLANTQPLSLTEPRVLLWGDPVFHNLLVSEQAAGYCLSGLFDFQQAGVGHRISDLTYVEGDFGRRRPPGVYEHPEYLPRFYTGYTSVMGDLTPIPDALRQITRIVRAALGIRFEWNCMRCFSPPMPEQLQLILDGITHLKCGAEE